MDFLDHLALPQTHEHLILLKFLLGLTFTLFVPYLAILMGSTFFALLFKSKKSDEKDISVKLARDIINIATLNKSVVFVFGLVPLISALFCYMQILQGAGSSVSIYMILAFVSFLIAVILLYNFKNSFNLTSIFSYIEEKQYKIEEEDTRESYEEYKEKSNRGYEKSGVWGLILLVITAVLFVSAVELASDASSWDTEHSFIGMLFSLGTISYLLYLLAASITVTSAIILFYYYRVKKSAQGNKEFFATARSISIQWGILSIVAQPVFIALGLVFTPESSLSSMSFIVDLLLIVALLVAASLFYLMMKDAIVNYSVPILILAIVAFVFSNIEDQVTFATASKYQLAKLEQDFITYEEEFKAGLGIQTVVVSGADIYNAKCIACHAFDKRITGPPYNDVIPKYLENKDALVKFVLNPVKVNPDYPSMPNQGLKPNEADAIADYLLSTYKESHGLTDSTSAGTGAGDSTVVQDSTAVSDSSDGPSNNSLSNRAEQSDSLKADSTGNKD